MKNIAVVVGILLCTAGAVSAQTTPSPNTHAPEQNSQTYPQGEPSAPTDSVKSKLMKGTQSSRNARRSQNRAMNKDGMRNKSARSGAAMKADTTRR